ncbi:MAG: bifunctional nuclease family protein [Bacteroidales bacterium]|nr:bifunctional nuclease family protein [Bacteroidales bacterium]
MRINDIEYIEVTVFDVRSSTQAMEAFSMILVDKSNLTHYVPIIIGLNEARAILGELHGRLPQRPLTHALFVDLIANNIPDYNIEFVSINEFSQGIYYASIVIQTPTESFFEVDARPSDAVAIALCAGVPIYFNKVLFEEQMQVAVKSSNIQEGNLQSENSGLIRSTPEATTAQSEWAVLSLPELKDMLQNAIEEENYELAAKIQEEIDRRKT